MAIFELIDGAEAFVGDVRELNKLPFPFPPTTELVLEKKKLLSSYRRVLGVRENPL